MHLWQSPPEGGGVGTAAPCLTPACQGCRPHPILPPLKTPLFPCLTPLAHDSLPLARYASLFFLVVMESKDNKLITLEKIHLFVEVLDRYFGNVGKLDIIFNFHKVRSPRRIGSISLSGAYPPYGLPTHIPTHPIVENCP